MELKDFVKNTILDIVSGVKEAQAADTSGAIIVSPKSQTEYHYGEDKRPEEPVEAILQIRLRKEKKDQVLRLVFGDNNIEILNK